MGRQCQIKTTVPSTELTPPMPDPGSNSPIDPQSASVESEPVENENVSEETETAEPLGPIAITDPPSTIDPSATAGKWPTEPPTDSPSTEDDEENET